MWLLALLLVTSETPALTFRSHTVGHEAAYESIVRLFADRVECSDSVRSRRGAPVSKTGTSSWNPSETDVLIAKLELLAAAKFPLPGSLHFERVEWTYEYKGKKRSVWFAPLALGKQVNCRSTPQPEPPPGTVRLLDFSEDCDLEYSPEEEAVLDLRNHFFSLVHSLCGKA